MKNQKILREAIHFFFPQMHMNDDGCWKEITYFNSMGLKIELDIFNLMGKKYFFHSVTLKAS